MPHRIGLCSWAFSGVERGQRHPGDLFRIAMENGFAFVEGNFASRGPLSATASVELAKTEHGLNSLATLELYRFPVNAANPLVRQRAQKWLLQMAECASALSVDSISFSPGPIGHEAFERAIGPACDVIEEVAKSAAALNVRLALENLPHHVLQDRASMRSMLAKLPSSIGVCLDVGNTIMDPPLSEWLREFEGRIIKLHISRLVKTPSSVEQALPELEQFSQPDLRHIATAIENGVQPYVEARLTGRQSENEFIAKLRPWTGDWGL